MFVLLWHHGIGLTDSVLRLPSSTWFQHNCLVTEAFTACHTLIGMGETVSLIEYKYKTVFWNLWWCYLLSSKITFFLELLIGLLKMLCIYFFWITHIFFQSSQNGIVFINTVVFDLFLLTLLVAMIMLYFRSVLFCISLMQSFCMNRSLLLSKWSGREGSIRRVNTATRFHPCLSGDGYCFYSWRLRRTL